MRPRPSSTGDQAVNDLYHQLDDVAVQLLARQQPVATDLRAIVTGLRMSSDLERVGDYAVHIAKVARRRHPASVVPVELRTTILEMGQAATRIAIKAGTVIATRDLILAAQLLADDDTIDDLHAQLFEQLLSAARSTTVSRPRSTWRWWAATTSAWPTTPSASATR